MVGDIALEMLEKKLCRASKSGLANTILQRIK